MISKLIERLKKSKRHREAFVASQVKNDTPFQIRALRDAEGWTQTEFGQKIGIPQSVVSRMENPDSGFLSIKTLLRVASIFDVALVVRFVPFVELACWAKAVPYEVKGLSPQALAPPKFDKDPMFQGSQKTVMFSEGVSIASKNEEIAKQKATVREDIGDMGHLPVKNATGNSLYTERTRSQPYLEAA